MLKKPVGRLDRILEQKLSLIPVILHQFSSLLKDAFECQVFSQIVFLNGYGRLHHWFWRKFNAVIGKDTDRHLLQKWEVYKPEGSAYCAYGLAAMPELLFKFG